MAESRYEGAFEHLDGSLQEREKHFDTLFKSVGLFLDADTVEKKKTLVGLHTELLNPNAELVLQYFSSRLDEPAQRWVRLHRRLLAACREDGVDVAFAKHSALLDEKFGRISVTGRKHWKR